MRALDTLASVDAVVVLANHCYPNVGISAVLRFVAAARALREIALHAGGVFSTADRVYGLPHPIAPNEKLGTAAAGRGAAGR